MIRQRGEGNRGDISSHYFGRFERTGFPNQFFNDSWVVGFLEGADHGWEDVGLEGRAWTLA
jgi:hypothetical protein